MGDNYEVLNDWGGVSATLRTRASGKQRVTVDVKAEAVVVNTDPAYWVQPVADAIAGALRRAIAGITTPAAPATEDARKVAANAFARGARWAMKRYAGGRMGPMAPRPSSKLLDDSGRLIKSVVARFAQRTQHAGTAVINVAANRLSEPLVRSRVLAILAQHVPWIRNPQLLGRDPLVHEALRETLAGAQQKAETSRLAVLKAAIEAGRSVGELGHQFGEATEPEPE
jgi:hypothetical protein